MIQFFKNAMRCICACLAAFLVVNSMCLLYSRLPRHKSNPTGATDYIWESHYNYLAGTEGYAFGKTNNEGFNNLFDYTGQSINCLLLGSSQMEAFNIPQNRSAAALLNANLSNNITYNIGVSGHDFYTVFSNLDCALQQYRPTDYVVIQIGDVNLDEKALEKVNDGKYPEIISHDSGIVYHLQKIELLRLINKQLTALARTQNSTMEKCELPSENYKKELLKILQNAKKSCEQYSCDLIICYTPSVKLNVDGTLAIDTNQQYVDVFNQLCKEVHINFINMQNSFTLNYYDKHILPYGFSNTQMGSGHLNENGHKMIATQLYQALKEVKQ